MAYTINQFANVLVADQVSVPSTANGQQFSGSTKVIATGALAIPADIQGVRWFNTSSTESIYFWYTNAVSSTITFFELGPRQPWESLEAQHPLNQIYLRASGTALLSYVIYG